MLNDVDRAECDRFHCVARLFVNAIGARRKSRLARTFYVPDGNYGQALGSEKVHPRRQGGDKATTAMVARTAAQGWVSEKNRKQEVIEKLQKCQMQEIVGWVLKPLPAL